MTGVGVGVGMRIEANPKCSEKVHPVSQIPHYMSCDRTQADTLGYRRLTACSIRGMSESSYQFII
jgi:hypothetical protein